MVVQPRWSGLEVRAVRDALRETRRSFAELTGLKESTIRRWERRGAAVTLRPEHAAVMDTVLSRANDRQLTIFSIRCRELGQRDRDLEHPVSTPKLDDDRSARMHPLRPNELTEIDEMKRRQMLRLLSSFSSTLAVAAVAPVDWDRIAHAERTGTIDAAGAAQYATINQALWVEYAQATTKATIFPAVFEHLGMLDASLRQHSTDRVRRVLARHAANALQLAGELLFDNDKYLAAAHCYRTASELADDAADNDLWACALTRHALIELYDQRPTDAAALLHAAAPLARRGDNGLATRFWVDTVLAQACAATGDLTGCERAFDNSAAVQNLPSPVPNSGWLRFDGTRLDEEHASCYIKLGRPEHAEQLLTPLLERPLSARRRAGVLVDLAASGAQRRDTVQLVMYGNAAADIARRTRSGYLTHRLQQLQPYLPPLNRDRHVQHLDSQIVTLSTRLQ